MTHDPVNRPAHYTAGAIECIDAIDTAMRPMPTPFLAYCLGNVIKYVWRAPLKGAFRQDLEKARWYLDRAIAAAPTPVPTPDAVPRIMFPALDDLRDPSFGHGG